MSKRTTILAACLAVVACKSAPSVRDGSGPEGAPRAAADVPAPVAVGAPADVASSPADGATDRGLGLSDEVTADTPAVDVAAGADEGAEPLIEVPVTVQFRKRAGPERYLGYARFWTENFSLERRVGDGWETVSAEEPLCVDPCPADGPPPECRFCSPPTPQPSIRTVSGLSEWTWYGVEYVHVPGPGSYCYCHRKVTAAAGRYRVTLCTHPQAECESGTCPPVPGVESYGFTKGEAVCDSVEFDFRNEAQTVVLDVGPGGAAPGNDAA